MIPPKIPHPLLDTPAIISRLKALANPDNLAGMARFGINTDRTFGVSMPPLFAIARETGRSHELAEGLWNTGYREARILAALVDEPGRVSVAQMDAWARDFDSWDVCDQACNKLFVKTPHAWNRAFAWVEEEPEFVRRAGFVMMATLAVHDKSAGDDVFRTCLPVILRHATDERNFVRKAVNWALRQIGKRNPTLRSDAIEAGKAMLAMHPSSKSARWIARDALRELE